MSTIKLFEIIVDVFSWLKIVASPLLIGSIIGFCIYLNEPNNLGLIIAIIFVLIGALIGIFWASRVWKKHGTTNYLSSTFVTDKESKDIINV
jgi:disulfide bond formation protein DsbB